jgi:hypothetical protein
MKIQSFCIIPHNETVKPLTTAQYNKYLQHLIMEVQTPSFSEYSTYLECRHLH